MNRLLIFGFGYSARFIAASLRGRFEVHGTSRSADGLAATANAAAIPVAFEDAAAVQAAVREATHVVISTPPIEGHDPALARYGDVLGAAPRLTWMGYLSTVGVYGNHDGAWVDEDTPLMPDVERSLARASAERDVIAFAAARQCAADIFRLSGIYGPGRSPLDRVRSGASSVVKPGQVFNRIHVDDIAGAVAAAIGKPGPAAETRVFNVSDDEPAPPQDVAAYAAHLLGLPAPPQIPFDKAELPPMARSFYADNKRVSNAKVKRELGLKFRYPTYREGLLALVRERGTDGVSAP